MNYLVALNLPLDAILEQWALCVLVYSGVGKLIWVMWSITFRSWEYYGDLSTLKMWCKY